VKITKPVDRKEKIKKMEAKTNIKLYQPPDGNEMCVICCENFPFNKEFKLEEYKGDTPVVLPCDHRFCLDCLLPCFTKDFLKCPVCSKLYGIFIGTQPRGTMTTEYSHPGKNHEHLEGYKKYTTIIMDFDFPDGIQDADQPNPGSHHTGTFRTAYLPDTTEGREIFNLFKVAFERRVLFRIGTSVTTGEENTVIYNGIHLKTNTCGGSSNFGFPDDGYFQRVKDELSKFGITAADAQYGSTLKDKIVTK